MARPRKGNTVMEVFSVRVPTALVKRLRAEARRRKLQLSDLVRERLEAAPTPARVAPPEDDGAVLGAIRARSQTSLDGLVAVPDLVRELGAQGLKPAFVHQWLLALDRDGTAELRPESGVGTLSVEDAALCPRGSDGTVLSLVRLRRRKPRG